jgi:hypothetical protein
VVQSSKLSGLRSTCEARTGRTPCSDICDQAELDREYYLGSSTGDYGCMISGATFPKSDYRDWKAK